MNGLSPQPDHSSSELLVTAVGGTSELVGKRGNVVRTTGWETSLDFIDYSGTKRSTRVRSLVTSSSVPAVG